MISYVTALSDRFVYWLSLHNVTSQVSFTYKDHGLAVKVRHRFGSLQQDASEVDVG
jgi:hypothetical protein